METTYRCPKCGNKEGITISAIVHTQVYTDSSGLPQLGDVDLDSDFELDEAPDAAWCQECEHTGSAAAFVDGAKERPPALIGRFARCNCGNTAPSDPALPKFEYLGYGSREAGTQCAICGANILTHGQGQHAFIPKGPAEYDYYYCGH